MPMFMAVLMLGRRAMLVMVALPTVLLGMVTRWPSRLRTRVLRKPMVSTIPSMVSSVMRSPMRNGLSMNTATAPKRLATVSCAARPSARPPTDRPAMAAVMSNPRFCEVTSTATTTTKTLSVLRMMGKSCSSNVRSASAADRCRQ